MSQQDRFHGAAIRIHEVKLKSDSDLQTYGAWLCELLHTYGHQDMGSFGGSGTAL